MPHKEQTDQMTLKELCKHLNISEATGRNWLKSGRLLAIPDADGAPLFSDKYAEAVRAELVSKERSPLRSRRNKTYAAGRRTYRSYLDCGPGAQQSVSSAAALLDSYLAGGAHNAQDDTAAAAVIADCAVQLILQRFAGGNSYSHIEGFLDGRINLGKYSYLIDDLIGNMGDDILSLSRSHPELFATSYVYEEASDILGMLYLSISAQDRRKSRGAYYTPASIANHMCEVLFDGADKCDGTILDPCAGTGSFLLQLPQGFDARHIYGNDLDMTAVCLMRINIALKYGICDRDYLYSHFTCRNFLTEPFGMEFDYIIGNPPWGAGLDGMDKAWYCSHYSSAQGKKFESSSLMTEKAISCLKPGGALSFILPESILNVRSHRSIRKYICESCSLTYLEFLGEAFDGVQCPSVILMLRKNTYVNQKPDSTGALLSCMGAHIVSRGGEFIINSERSITPDIFSLYASDEEYAICRKLCGKDGIRHLAGHADFALGIVTGDNKRFVSSVMSDGLEPVLSGRDIHRYRCDSPTRFIRFSPGIFQQAAPDDLYRAPEKLLYRFIGGKLTFAYDSAGTLSLNSCNILIPHLDGMDIKYVLAVLNSSAAQFYFDKTFHSVKLLRSHIEQLPIPAASRKEQSLITGLVDEILCLPDKDSSSFDELCRGIDLAISRLYGLTADEHKALDIHSR